VAVVVPDVPVVPGCPGDDAEWLVLFDGPFAPAVCPAPAAAAPRGWVAGFVALLGWLLGLAALPDGTVGFVALGEETVELAVLPDELVWCAA
jgi:hypothetical protein